MVAADEVTPDWRIGAANPSPRLRVNTQTTDLYYDHARNYSPTLGVWISQDPAGYINGADTYQFVLSNPAGRTDPTGKCWACFWAVVDATEMQIDYGAAVFAAYSAMMGATAAERAGPAEAEAIITAEGAILGTIGLAYREYNDITNLIHDAHACARCNPCEAKAMNKKFGEAQDMLKRTNDLVDKLYNMLNALKKLL